MERYDYMESLKEDIKDYIKENMEYLEGKDEQELYDDFFVEDAITGNASGSYYCNAWKAEEALCHNMDLLQEALQEFGYTENIDNELITSAEWCDVTIRCYLLGNALSEVLDEIEWEWK